MRRYALLLTLSVIMLRSQALDVRTLGAKGDGATIDSPAINAAIVLPIISAIRGVSPSGA